MKRLITWATTLCVLLSAGFGEAVSAFVQSAADTGLAAAVTQTEIISPAIGTVTHAQVGDSAQNVILIQDLHCAADVQKKISDILAVLDNRYHLKNVYIEGGYGPLSTAWLSDIRDEQAKNELREKLLACGRLTGSENYAVTANRPDLLVGVDEEITHKKNLMRLAEIVNKREYFASKLEQLHRDRAVLSRIYLHPRNARFNAVLSAYRSGKIPPRKFYRLLRKYVDIVNNKARPDLFSIDLAAYPQMQRFSEEAEMMHRLDQAQFAHDLRGFIGVLKQQLPYRVFQQLAHETNNFSDLPQLLVSLGHIISNEDLRHVCRQSFPVLYEYLTFRGSGQSCNPVALIAEERRLIEQIRFGLSEDISDLDLAFIDECFGYLEKYMHAELSADDLDYVQRNFARFRELWRTYSYDTGLEELCRDSELLKSFYAVNQQRNEIFLRSIASREPLVPGTYLTDVPAPAYVSLGERLRNSRVIVLVTGGFHAKGLTDLLAARNISAITITPTVTADPGPAGAVYAERARAQAKLFAGQAIALTVESQGVPVVSITDTTIVMDVNGERVSLTRGERAAQPFWHWQGGAGMSEQGIAAAKAFEVALNAMIGFLQDVHALSNPSRQHEALYRILKFLARQASAAGVFRGYGLIDEIAGDASIQRDLSRAESLSVTECAYLGKCMQQLIAAHVQANAVAMDTAEVQAGHHRQDGDNHPDSTASGFSTEEILEEEHLKNVMEQHMPVIIDKKQAHIRKVIGVMEAFIAQNWDALYDTFTPESGVDKAAYIQQLTALFEVFRQLSPECRHILRVATIFHDIGSQKNTRDWIHYKTGAAFIKGVLASEGYSEAFIDRVAKMIYGHGLLPDLGIDFLPADLAALSAEEKDILLLLSIFDMSGSVRGNTCVPGKIQWLIDLHSGTGPAFREERFYEYRFVNMLFPPFTSDEQREINRFGIQETLLADSYLSPDEKEWWNNRIRVYVPALFQSTGMYSPACFTRMIDGVNKAISARITDEVTEIIIDSDNDFMSLDQRAREPYLRYIRDLLDNGQDVPVSVTVSGRVMTVTILLQPSTDHSMLKSADTITGGPLKSQKDRYVFTRAADRSAAGHLTVNGREARFLGMGSMTQVFEHPEHPEWVVRINVSGRAADMATEYRKFTMLATLGLAPRAIQCIKIDQRYDGLIVERVRPVPDQELRSSASGTLLAALLDSLIKNKLIMLDFNPHNIVLGVTGNSSTKTAYIIDVSDVLHVPYLSESLLRDLYCCIYNLEADDWKKSLFNTAYLERSQEHITEGKYFILKMIRPIILYQIFCKTLSVYNMVHPLLRQRINRHPRGVQPVAADSIGKADEYTYYPSGTIKSHGSLLVNGKPANYIGRGAHTLVFEHPENSAWAIRLDVSHGVVNLEKEFSIFNQLAELGITPRALKIVKVGKNMKAMIVQKIMPASEDIQSRHELYQESLDELIGLLIRNRLLVMDFVPSNIVTGRINDGPVKAYICDVSFAMTMPFPKSLVSVLYMQYCIRTWNFWPQYWYPHVVAVFNNYIGIKWYSLKMTTGELLLPYITRGMFARHSVANLYGMVSSLFATMTHAVMHRMKILARILLDIIQRRVDSAATQVTHLVLNRNANIIVRGTETSSTYPVYSIPVHWHYRCLITGDPYSAVQLLRTHDTKTLDAEVYVMNALPKDALFAAEPTGILVNGKSVVASAIGGRLSLFCAGEEPQAIIEAVSRMLIGQSGMPGDEALRERFSALLQQATGVPMGTRFTQGILIDHGWSGRHMAYTPWGAMIVSADFLDTDNQSIAGSDTAEILASLQTVQRTESFVAAQNIYYYLDQSDDAAKFLTAPASFCVAKNAQVIISAALLADYTPKELWDMTRRARRTGITVYVDLGNDDTKKTAWRDLGFSGYLQGDDGHVRIHDYILQGTVINAAHIRGYQNAGELREKLAAARENGKILRYSEAKEIVASLSLMEQLDMLAGMVTGMLPASISETQVRAMAHAWERTALPPLPDNIAAVLRVVASGTAAELQAVLDIQHTDPAYLYLEKIRLQAGDPAQVEKLQKLFLVCMVQRLLAKNALDSAKIAKPLGLQDPRLEILLGEKLLWLALRPGSQLVPSEKVQKFILSHREDGAQIFYQYLFSCVDDLASQDSVSAVADLITLILECAEPRLPKDMGDSDTLFNIDATGDFLSAA